MEFRMTSSLPGQHSDLVLWIVLLGRRKSGKSSTGNSILGKEEFATGKKTTMSERHFGSVDGQRVGVVDTPGWSLFSLANPEKWKDADVALISERMVSSIHAIMASTSGVLIVASCSDIMTDRHRLATDFVLFGAPYMAYDIYAMYQVHYLSEQDKGHEAYKGHSLHTVTKFLHKDFLLVLHHIALITIFMPVTLFLRRGLGDFFIGCFLTTELSTPFVSIGKVLIQLGLQDSTLHKINVSTFFTNKFLRTPPSTKTTDISQYV
ncbi:hypothetical protein AALO_G00198530 [Alosa alosa]|uniref:TLC domain-containing protein n=1 Tax=Alosa alosa TaxID=278164 RepID=A0AAV6G1X7_9TELE|nr:hypothetical protein AALO_G00198530 [Alosa alosa]